MITNQNTEFTQETIIGNQNKILAAQAMILASLEKLDLVLNNQHKLELFFSTHGLNLAQVRDQNIGNGLGVGKVETVGNTLNA